MPISQNLTLNIKQTANLNVQMQQSLQVLQLGNVELLSFIEEELEINPFLDKNTEDNNNIDLEYDNKNSIDENLESTEILDPHIEELATEIDFAQPYISSQSNFYEDRVDFSNSHGKKNKQFDLDINYIENVAAKDISLNKHVNQQINLANFNDKQKIIALQLLEYLDDNGYLNASYKEIVDVIKCQLKDIEEVIGHLQLFDPPGVFARNLSECLQLQLRDLNRYDPIIATILENLDLVATHDLVKLSKISGVELTELKEIIVEIKSLNPKPGLLFEKEISSFVIPDVFLKQTKDGFIIELNPEAMPSLLINKEYYSLMKKKDKSFEKSFYVDKYQRASWLLRAIEQRADTILKVSTEIAIFQQDFFHKGVNYLKPMILRDIAEKIDMHESTVSRVINGKYLSTNMGVFELKYFFSSALKSSVSKDSFSSKSVKNQIKKIIDEENNNKILSDGDILSLLAKNGIKIARRTIVKYREEMNIPSSVIRRKQKLSFVRNL